MREKKQLRLNIFFIMIFMIWGVCEGVLYAQQVDPFYTDLLKRGEQSYLDGNYEEAIKQIEVAAFGVYGNKNLLAIADLYLCLCHYALNDIEKCEKYLKDTEALVEGAGLDSVEIHDKARENLEELMFQLRPEEPENPVLAGKSQEELKQEIRELAVQIKTEPENMDLYLSLYDHYMAVKNYKEARKTIENLVKKNPTEITGYYLIGVAHYIEGKYDDAVDRFNRFFQFSQNVSVDEELLINARAYLILSYYKDGKKERSLEIMGGSVELFVIRTIRGLPLDRNDKVLLWNIRETYRKKQQEL
jgi:tetratricopeptide (TPR) repeat protein